MKLASSGQLLQFARYGGDQVHRIRRELVVRKIQLVYSDPVPGMEDEFEAIGEKVVKR